MIRINGRSFLEQTSVPEFGEVGDTREIKRGCDDFFHRRGVTVLDGHDLNHADFENWKKRRARRKACENQ